LLLRTINSGIAFILAALQAYPIHLVYLNPLFHTLGVKIHHWVN